MPDRESQGRSSFHVDTTPASTSDSCRGAVTYTASFSRLVNVEQITLQLAFKPFDRCVVLVTSTNRYQQRYRGCHWLSLASELINGKAETSNFQTWVLNGPEIWPAASKFYGLNVHYLHCYLICKLHLHSSWMCFRKSYYTTAGVGIGVGVRKC